MFLFSSFTVLLHSRWKVVMDMIFPTLCMWCETPWSLICSHCLSMSQGHPEICPLCHIPSSDYRICISCHISNKQTSYYYQWVLIAFMYTWAIKKGILWLKYYHCYSYVSWFVDKLSLLIRTHTTLSRFIYNDPASIAVTYIPSHRYRHYFQKWYNQSKLLAKGVADALGLSLLPMAQKIRFTSKQTWLSRSRRLINLRKAFVIKKDIPSTIHTIIIIDDIVTTWSTINELARSIKEKYPSLQVRWAVIGRDGW